MKLIQIIKIMPPELTGPQIAGIILAVVIASGLVLAWAFRDEESSSSLREATYKQARKIVANRMEDGTQLTPKFLEKRYWVYRDGYWVDPKANAEKRVHIKFQAGGKFDKIHYYQVYHCVKNEDNNIKHNAMVYFTTESSVEWLETHLLCINKKPEKLI